jgi:hypothetical protein
MPGKRRQGSLALPERPMPPVHQNSGRRGGAVAYARPKWQDTVSYHSGGGSMSHGLGAMQRQMLFALARHEVGIAETAAELQRPYRSPDRWSLAQLIYVAARDPITARQRAAHEWNENVLKTGTDALKQDEQDRTPEQNFAGGVIVARVNLNRALRRPTRLNPKEFEPEWPDDHERQRFHPSRAIVGLERRGFVLRDNYHRFVNLALTVAGFAEARRLGGVPDSEIVDLDRVQANWREPDDFLLGVRSFYCRPDDADGIRLTQRMATDPDYAELVASLNRADPDRAAAVDRRRARGSRPADAVSAGMTG